ncbi:hypothetical protein [Roseomonas xinghualingensis]|uniref:hypothetical protein n=1 Tax=Roseomonas xinghualingensis TaxID=2986475 RepID=UPI0021F19B4A|nr:hypothetical protein [Roseomonas sp. SXEYE001]MCV4207604.1 hypothetical protein [Roseomonas sp. SXEYE001]
MTSQLHGFTLPGFSVTSQDGHDVLVKIAGLELYFYREFSSFFGHDREGSVHVFAAGRFRLCVERFGRPAALPAIQDKKVAA